MIKRFSLVDLGEVQVVKSGYIKPDFLPEIEEYVKLIHNTYTYEEIKVVISHLLFLEEEGGGITDATDEEVVFLQERLKELDDSGCIVWECDKYVEKLYGVKEDEIVERFM